MNNAEILKKLAGIFGFEDISWKIQVTNRDKTQGMAVPYLDSRAIQKRLDEAVGAMNWRNEFLLWQKNAQICGISLFNAEREQWITKYDGAENTDIEPIKGGLSDSFKRACFNWGIGRELYSAPFIWIPASRTEIQRKGEKFCCSERFTVSSIEYNVGHEITGLVIKDGKNRVVYELKPEAAGREEPAEGTESGSGTGRKRNGSGKQAEGKPPVSAEQMDSLEKELQRTGVGMDAVKERYQIESPENMSEEIYRKVMNALAKTKTKVA